MFHSGSGSQEVQSLMGAIHQMLLYLGVALSVSFDSLAVGAAYAAKGTRLPGVSLTYVSLSTATLMALSMKAGSLLSAWASPGTARFWGGVTLVALGVWQAWQGYVEVLEEKMIAGQRAIANDVDAGPRKLVSLRIESFGLIVQILKEPLAADRDSSGVIDPKESVLLGIALGLDAFAAGFGAGMSGFSWAIVPLVAAFCPLLLLAGSLLGGLIRESRALRKCYALPGAVLVVIGLLKVTGHL